jgi:transposase
MSEISRRSRRSWSVAFKRRVVAEASAPDVSVSAVARRYDLNANQVFNWRRRYGGGGVFLPVAVVGSEPPGLADKDGSAPESPPGEIEISLAAGHRVRIRGSFDPDRVARLLRGLSS